MVYGYDLKHSTNTFCAAQLCFLQLAQLKKG